MKFYSTIICIKLLVSISLLGNTSPKESFDLAVSKYDEQEYDQAREIFAGLTYMNDPQIYYNLGNAYYRLGNMAKAILYYEKSIKWGGTNDDIEYNLQQARSFLKDDIKMAPELLVWQYWKNISTTFTANTWSILALIFLIAFVLSLLIYGRLGLKPSALSLSAVLCIFAIFGYALALTKHRLETVSIAAIVTHPSVAVKSEPSTSAKDLFIIHAGIKLKLLQESREWYEVKLPNGNVGWIKEEYMEGI